MSETKIYGFQVQHTVQANVTVRASTEEEARTKLLNGDYLDWDSKGEGPTEILVSDGEVG